MKGEDEWDKIFTKVRMNGMKGEDEWDKIFTKVRVYGIKMERSAINSDDYWV